MKYSLLCVSASGDWVWGKKSGNSGYAVMSPTLVAFPTVVLLRQITTNSQATGGNRTKSSMSHTSGWVPNRLSIPTILGEKNDCRPSLRGFHPYAQALVEPTAAVAPGHLSLDEPWGLVVHGQ